MREVVLVCGFGRCGSSMVMQMLAAGGLPCVGRAPAYEDPRAYPRAPLDAAWVAALKGQAVKVLDPHICQPPPGLPYKVIWLDRLAKEQARSQAKFLRLTCGMPLSRRETQGFAASYRIDRPAVEALFRRLGASVLQLRFEAILRSPRRAALEIVGHLSTALDVDAMAAAVITRPHTCQRGLEIETTLTRLAMQKEAAHA